MDPYNGKSSVKTATKHAFQVHSYKKPTFCAHCKNLLLGITKQGLQCKRCELNVHKKCQEDLAEKCRELIVGHHNFLEKTYKHPTFCNWCGKLLAGVINQGLHCSECDVDVHEKCQEKIESQCSKTRERMTKKSQEKKTRKDSKTSTSSKESTKQKSKTPTSSLSDVTFEKVERASSVETTSSGTINPVFEKVETREEKRPTPKPSPMHTPLPSPKPSPAPSPKRTRPIEPVITPRPAAAQNTPSHVSVASTDNESARILYGLDDEPKKKMWPWCCCC